MWHLCESGKLARYWDLPDKQIANNSRVASVSVHFAVIAKFGTVAGVESVSKPVYMLVRDPIERYISALRKEASGHIEPNTGNHFELQSDLAVGPKVFLYRFPEHLEQFGRDTGLGVIPWVNKSQREMLILTDSQRLEALKRYVLDVALFNSICHPKDKSETV